MNRQPSSSTAALLTALRDAPVNSAVADALKLRVQSRLSASLLGLTPTLAADSVGISASSVAVGGRVARGLAVNKTVVAACLAPVFALGVLAGIAADRWHYRQAATKSNHAAQPHQALASPQPAPVAEPIITPDDLTRLDAEKPVAGAAPAPNDASSTLAAERSLLDQARQALARGEPAAGFAPLDRHAARFPRGILTEEREALAVRLLAALGRNQAATARAESFHRRYPNSLFTPAVNNAIATISRRNNDSESKP